MRSRTTALALMTLFTAGLLLAACDEQEQGRAVHFEKGPYIGKPDTPLSEEKLNDLRQRATNQAGF